LKKIFSIALSVLLFFSVFTGIPAQAAPEKVTINVYNWGQYISDGTDGTLDVNAEFTKRTGIEVNYTTFDSNETMLTKLETGGSSYDIIIPSDYMIERLIEKDMLEELDFSNIPNYQYIDSQFKDLSYDPENKYSVPYTYGTVGIIYNTKYVTEKVDSWSILWDDKYFGKILTFDNPRDLFAIAQFLLGYSINSTAEEEYEACYNKLLEQKHLIKQYVMDQIFDSMINEAAWIAPYYAGDFLTMQQDNPDLAFAYPKEGFNYFVDAICIPKGSKNKAAAEAYINFLCDPEISGQNMDGIGYATPISEAKQYLSEEFATSEAVYPSADTLERAQIFSNLDDDSLQRMNDYWSKLKIGDADYTKYIIIGSVVLLIIIATLINKKRKSRLYEE